MHCYFYEISLLRRFINLASIFSCYQINHFYQYHNCFCFQGLRSSWTAKTFCMDCSEFKTAAKQIQIYFKLQSTMNLFRLESHYFYLNMKMKNHLFICLASCYCGCESSPHCFMRCFSMLEENWFLELFRAISMIEDRS